jgi:hypothetical protein
MQADATIEALICSEAYAFCRENGGSFSLVLIIKHSCKSPFCLNAI